MQLNLFNGGLNVRLRPNLIQVNEAVIYQNIDNSSGALVSIKANTDLNQTVNKSMYYFNNQWVSSTEDIDYVEFQEKLYYSNGIGIPQKSTNGTTWYNLGIVKPSSKPTVALGTSTGLTGTYQYCYTYYNTNDGSESMPSVYSDEIVATDDKINVTIVASTDAQVTNIRLYRLGGSLTSMVLVTTLANTSVTYTDSISDIDVDGTILDSFGNGQAPSGLKYLTEAGAMFFGSIGDKLYYTDIAYINNWNPFYFIDFADEITGIGQAQNGLMVFTKYKTYIITGNSPLTLSKYLLNANQGCVLHKTIKYSSNTLAWLSTDGICLSAGGEIQVITRDKLGKLSLSPICAAVYDDVYYISHSTGTLVLDFRYGVIFRTLDFKMDGMHVANDVLYGSYNSKLYSLGTSEDSLSMTYKSPKLSDGALTNIKNYKTIYVYSTGNITFKVYIDDELLVNKLLADGLNEVKLPQANRLGQYIQFEVTGTGTILEIEYKVEMRQNGR